MKQVERDIRNKFKTVLGDYADRISEHKIKIAIDDVIETSAIEDEGYYSDGDITLAFQRTITGYLK